jgi:hypothetical protein
MSTQEKKLYKDITVRANKTPAVGTCGTESLQRPQHNES